MSDTFIAPAGSSPFGRLVKYGFFGVVALILLALLVAGFENWRGRRAWQKFRTEWEAKGEQFDIAAFIPKPVPPEQNFATTPLLAPLLDYIRPPGQPAQWNDPPGKQRAEAMGNFFKDSGRKKAPMLGQWQTGRFLDLHAWQAFLTDHTNPIPKDAARDVLAALRKFDAELAELTEASARPYSVFPVRYEENVNALFLHLAALRGISQVVRLRALARLQAGQKPEALQDVRLGLRLAESIESEAFLISQLVRIALLQIVMQPIWEGCARHEWTEEHLAQLQSTLSGLRLLEGYKNTIRGERAFGNALLDMMRSGRVRYSDFAGEGDSLPLTNIRFLPKGWIYQNQFTINRLHQERMLPLVDAAQHRVFVQQARDTENIPELQKFHLYNALARLLLPALGKTAAKFANAQTTVDLATVACALERHRLATGQYPGQLDLLVPRFIAKIPTDVITGELLKYRREPDGTFVLYSVGWNETDDGGEAGLTKSGTGPDPNQGDWVWRYPAKP